MQIQENEILLERLIKAYFSDANRFLWLRKGQTLIKEGALNNRLYFIHSGRLSGFVENEEQGHEIVFSASENNFLGVYSFFSKTYKSLVTIRAETDCELAYIDTHTQPGKDTICIEKDFMPFAVKDLVKRQDRLLQLSREKQDAQKQLLENQNLASLGQMAAGIAHELNNSIAVLGHNSEWLSARISAGIKNAQNAAWLKAGLEQGRLLSGREARHKKKALLAAFPWLDTESAALLAQMNADNAAAGEMRELSKTRIREFYEYWEMGTALHDMQAAYRQSAHVVKSVKSLGNVQKSRQPGMDLNDTIRNALTLLRHKTRDVDIQLELASLPAVTANSGDWIQVWTNLIKNSCEALLDSATSNPKLTISSAFSGKRIKVTVTDNGPGIPGAIFSSIFQPNVTTKIRGLSFGLGLGLTIVKRIITEYDGKIDVRSSDNGTTFTIYIPLGGKNV